MSMNLAECLQKIHFNYDFGGTVRPIHFVHQSGGKWHLALPFKRSEIIKYICGQGVGNNTVRYFISKTQFSFDSMEAMVEWFVQHDQNLSRDQAQEISSEVDYETIRNLKDKKPSVDNFNSFIKAVGLNFLTVSRVKSRRISGRLTVEYKSPVSLKMRQTTNTSFYIINQNAMHIDYNYEESYSCYRNFLQGMKKVYFEQNSNDASDKLNVELTDFDSSDNQNLMVKQIVNAINRALSNQTGIVINQENLGLANRFLYPVKSIMLAQLYCNSLNHVIQKNKLQSVFSSVVMSDWGVNISYAEQTRCKYTTLMSFGEFLYREIENLYFSPWYRSLGDNEEICELLKKAEAENQFKNHFMSEYETVHVNMDDWQKKLVSTIPQRVAS